MKTFHKVFLIAIALFAIFQESLISEEPYYNDSNDEKILEDRIPSEQYLRTNNSVIEQDMDVCYWDIQNGILRIISFDMDNSTGEIKNHRFIVTNSNSADVGIHSDKIPPKNKGTVRDGTNYKYGSPVGNYLMLFRLEPGHVFRTDISWVRTRGDLKKLVSIFKERTTSLSQAK